MKCDEKESSRSVPFKPESPLVIVCEGFQDAGFVYALLNNLKIDNCDVAFPKKKRDGANGKDGIPELVRLIAEEDSVEGIAIVRDADGSEASAFKDACAAFVGQFVAPKVCYAVEHGKHRTTGVYLLPGKGRTGVIENLLLDAVFATHKDLGQCVTNLEACVRGQKTWADNKTAKMRMQCVIASFCEDDPGCSLGFIWQKKKHNPIDINSPAFMELSDFLTDFTSRPVK